MRRTGIMLLMLSMVLLCMTALAEDTVSLLINTRTTQAFTNEAVKEEDLRTILEAGLSAASAINQQPWYFAAVTSREIMAEISSSAGGFGGAPGAGPVGNAPAGAKPEGAPSGSPMGMPGGSSKAGLGDSPAAIIVYMNESTPSPDPNFDCGLACQNMVIAAKALGYGTKIVSAPTRQLNGDNHDALCEKMGVDKAYKAVAVLLVGYQDDAVDGASGASARSGFDDKVSLIK